MGQWDQMGHNTQGDKMGPKGQNKTRWDKNGIQWDKRDQMGHNDKVTKWDQMGPNGTKWDQMGPDGTRWDRMGPNGTK